MQECEPCCEPNLRTNLMRTPVPGFSAHIAQLLQSGEVVRKVAQTRYQPALTRLPIELYDIAYIYKIYIYIYRIYRLTPSEIRHTDV